jgi:hypothetical protein
VPALPGPLRHVRRQAAAGAVDDRPHPDNEYDSIIELIEKWLKEKGVRFQMETRVRL